MHNHFILRKTDSQIIAVNGQIELLKTQIAQKNNSRLEKEQMQKDHKEKKGPYYLQIFILYKSFEEKLINFNANSTKRSG